MKNKKKNIKRKGFTLIELLAVIVILAIVLVVTIPSVISSMNKAKLSQLHNLAVSVAKWYDEALENDNLQLGNNILGDAKVPNDGHWYCLADIRQGGAAQKYIDKKYDYSSSKFLQYNLASKYGFNFKDKEDIVLYYYNDEVNVPVDRNIFSSEYMALSFVNSNYTALKFSVEGQIEYSNSNALKNSKGYDYLQKLCSQIRINENGKAEVLLVARRGGKFDTGKEYLAYALSSGVTGFDTIK